MILVIDAGNSRIKTAVYQESTMVATNFFENGQMEIGFKSILSAYPNIKNIVVSSVSNFDSELFRSFFGQYSIIYVSQNYKFPFNNLYETPRTLGIDRMVLASGAVLKFPNVNRLVVDAGTCITFDYIDQQNNYLGGAISLGLRMRYKSLNNYTAKLPLLETKFPENNIGNSTAESIHSGVVLGLLHEIDGVINDFKSKYSNFIIILTGGDAEFLAVRLKNTIFANSNFLLDSLNLLHIYNTKND